MRRLDPPAEVYVHPEHDPGCRLRSPEFLRAFARRSRHALVVLDLEGSGVDETNDRSVMEAQLEQRLRESGWQDRARVVVIAPELETWVWSDSPHVASVFGWTEEPTRGGLREWLTDREFLVEGAAKPARPKEAVEGVLYELRRPRSSALYRKLAETVGFRRCEDPAFAKLRELLAAWFPA